MAVNEQSNGFIANPHYLDLLMRIVVAEQKIVQIQDARDLQAAEYERRLEGLNHENARILAAQNEFLSKDVYDANQSALREWQTETSTALTTLQVAREADKMAANEGREAQTKTFTQLIAIVSLTLLILTFVLNFIIQ